MSAHSALSIAEQARKEFQRSVSQAVSDLVATLTTKCDVPFDLIDTNSFALSADDGLSDMIGAAIRSLQIAADEEGDAQASRELRADRADYHARVL